MRARSDQKLTPRNGHTLVVGIVARISGCANQKELSLDDQEDHGKAVATDMYDGPVEYRVIATKGKGERLDRPELQEIEQMARSRELDLLVMEDVGRLVRGAEAVRLWGVAVDHETRCIAPNDCCDTADESWEEDLLSACRDHVGHNAHTSKRLKQKLMNRFKKSGGAVPLVIYGYVKPPEAKTYADWQKDPAATPIIQEGLRRLRATLNCSAVADYFNQHAVPTGKYCRRKTWIGYTVRRYYQNSLLKGQPGRGFRHSVKQHETGRRVTVKNPNGPVYLEYPHLAHVDAAELDELNALLAAKNANYRRNVRGGPDTRWRVPRKRTKFPGQHARCWYCGRPMVWGGNGITEHLMCSGSREWQCWNSIGVSGPLAAEKIVEAITSELYNLRGFDGQCRELVEQAEQGCSGNVAEQRRQVQSDEADLALKKENLMAAILQYGPLPMFQAKLEEIEVKEKELARQKQHLERVRARELHLPHSFEGLRQMATEKFQELAVDSPEFGDLMRQLVPDFFIYLVRLFDGGHLMPRAKVRLTLANIVPDGQYAEGLSDLLTRELTLDLFRPPQRERIRQEVVRLTEEKWYQHQIAEQLPERPTQSAVQQALAFDRKMKTLGLESPWVTVLEPPEDYCKLRRHKNARFHFEPIPGYERPAI